MRKADFVTKHAQAIHPALVHMVGGGPVAVQSSVKYAEALYDELVDKGYITEESASTASGHSPRHWMDKANKYGETIKEVQEYLTSQSVPFGSLIERVKLLAERSKE